MTALTGQSSTYDASVPLSVSDSWGIWDLNLNLTNSPYLQAMMYSTKYYYVIDDKYIDDENEKSSQLMMFLMNQILDLRMKLLRIVRNK